MPAEPCSGISSATSIGSASDRRESKLAEPPVSGLRPRAPEAYRLHTWVARVRDQAITIGAHTGARSRADARRAQQLTSARTRSRERGLHRRGLAHPAA